MRFVKMGYYNRRSKVRCPVDRSEIRAAYGDTPNRLRLEVLEDAIILTDPRDQAWTHRND